MPTWEAKRRERETKNGARSAIFCLPPPLLAWIFTRKAPDPAGERDGAGKAALGRAAPDPEGAKATSGSPRGAGQAGPGAEGEDGTPAAWSLTPPRNLGRSGPMAGA